ncbi:MAG: glycosyltransferase family 4 protein [Ignavibacteriaceae bacterium]|nr:glycosyltransferase family 4 protein [Ignavibacteriaceae bacterium]
MMKPIKVCHIVNLITGQADGVYTHLKMIFKNYDKDKFEHILIFQGGEKIEKEVRELGVKVFTSESLKKKISLRAFSDINSIIDFEQIDIIHAHLIKPYAIAGLINIFLKKKFIFNYHGIFLKNNPYYNFIERSIYSVIHYLIHLLSKVDAVLVQSKMSKQLLMEETKLFPEPIVYYNSYSPRQYFSGVNANIVQRIEELKKYKRIIAVVGRLEVDKRIDRAIMLIRSLVDQQKNVHLLIFGDGSLKNKMDQLVQQHKLKDSVDIFGYVEEVEGYYKYFDLVLFTSDWEGMPLTMWEAMANEVPVVAPDVGGFKEILEENKCGLIYEPGNLKDAEDKLILLLEDVQLRKRMGINGREAIESNYTEKKFIQQIEKVYTNLMDE